VRGLLDGMFLRICVPGSPLASAQGRVQADRGAEGREGEVNYTAAIDTIFSRESCARVNVRNAHIGVGVMNVCGCAWRFDAAAALGS
jgi:hypothetical protein